MGLSKLVVVHCLSNLTICPIWDCAWPKSCQLKQHLGQTLWKPYIWFSRSNLDNIVSGNEALHDMERKWCELIGCYTHFVTTYFQLNHDLDLGFSRTMWNSCSFQPVDPRMGYSFTDVGAEGVVVLRKPCSSLLNLIQLRYQLEAGHPKGHHWFANILRVIIDYPDKYTLFHQVGRFEKQSN